MPWLLATLQQKHKRVIPLLLIVQQEAMGTLGMEADEIKALFKTVAGILHFGNIEVKQRPREEWATIPTTTGMLY